MVPDPAAGGAPSPSTMLHDRLVLCSRIFLPSAEILKLLTPVAKGTVFRVLSWSRCSVLPGCGPRAAPVGGMPSRKKNVPAVPARSIW